MSSGGGGSSLSMDRCSGKDYSPSYYDGTCGTAPANPKIENMNTSIISPTISISEGFLNNNPVINAYQFQSDKRFPQNITSELRSIIAKIVTTIEQKSQGNIAKKIAYYKAVDAYLFSHWKRSSGEKEKRILENLHLRLVSESNGILSYKSSTTVVQPNTQTTIVSIPVISVSATDFALLGIDFANPAFIGYDYTQNKRFPRTITTVLDRFTLSIVEKIDSKNNRDVLFIQILNLLDNKI